MIVIKVNYTTDQPIIKVNYDDSPIYISTTLDATYIKVDYGTGGGSGGAIWGDIIGNLSDQLDLQAALDDKVPYTGATGDVDLGEYELKAGQIELDQSPTGTAGVAVTRWNDAIGSTETTLKGGNVILKNGVDLIARVVNKVTPNTTLTKAAYQAVKISGAQGQRLAVALAQANNDNNSADTLGLVTETIPTNQEGFIMTVGNLEGINTTGSLQGETWSDGDVLYLSPTTPGAITKVKPNGSTGHIVVIGYVEYAHQNNGKIYVKIMNGWELDELHNVFISSPTNNDALIYESATSLWKNKSIATALGYTPGTVSSVALSVPTGLVVTSGSPITTSGTIAVGLQSGYSIPTTVKQGNWDDAYTFVSAFPSQTGNSGKYLTTDGSTLSWGTISTANIYNSDGTLTGNRTITSNGFSLKILGGIQDITNEQIGLKLETSTNAMTAVIAELNNTFTTTGKKYQLRSLFDGAFDIIDRSAATARFVIRTNGSMSLINSNQISTQPLTINGTTAIAGALQIQGSIINPTGAGAEIEYSGGISYLSSYNRPSTWIPLVIRASQIDFTTNGTNTSRLFSTGNLTIGGTTDAGYKLDVQGTTRAFQKMTIGGTRGFDNRLIIINDGNSSSLSISEYQSNETTLVKHWVKTFGSGLSFLNVGGAATNMTFVVGTNSQTTNYDGITINDFTGNLTSSSALNFFTQGRGFDGRFTARISSSNNVVNPYDTPLPDLRFWTCNSSLIMVEAMRIDNNQSLLIGTTSSVNSSLLTLASTTKGFLQPRMTTTQRDAIVSPATGLSVYNTTTNTSDFYNGTSWVSLAAGNIYTADGTLTGNRTVSTSSNNLTFTGSNFFNVKFGSTTYSNQFVWIGANVIPSIQGHDSTFSTVRDLALQPNGGKVGVGNNAPSELLEVTGTILQKKNDASGVILKLNNTSTSGKEYWLLSTGSGNTPGAGTLSIYDNTSAAYRLVLTSSGRFLLGTTTESTFLLDVNGTGRFTQGLYLTGPYTSSNYLSIGTGTGNAVFYWTSYRLSIGGVKLISEGIVGDPTGLATTTRASSAIDSKGYLVTDSIGIGTDTSAINSSAIAQINSTTKGFLPPRMTETQKNAISTPATGLIVYQTDGTEGLYERTSSAWRLINASGSGGGITRSVNNISTTTTAAAAASTDYVYLISGTTTLTLPTAAGNTNRYTLKNVGTGTVTINTTSSQTIDGSTSITMAVRYTALDVISDGTNWNII